MKAGGDGQLNYSEHKVFWNSYSIRREIIISCLNYIIVDIILINKKKQKG